MTQLKRVLHITYDMRIGGTEMVIKNIIEGRDQNSIEMMVFCIEEPLGPWGIDLRKSGIEIATKHRKDGFDVSIIKAIRAFIKNNNIDIVHCHQYTPWVYGSIAALGLSAKVIFTEHGRFYPDSSSWKRRYINPLLLSITNKITAISEATKVALADYEFIPTKYCDVVYNGISPMKRSSSNTEQIKQKLKLKDSTFILGTVARLDPIKNHLMMIKGLKICISKGLDVHLIIVGDGETRQEIVSLANSLGVTEHLTITGYLKDPSDYMNCFDLYLLTSFSEGTSMTLLEAMSVGLACVVTDVGGNPEIIQHKKNGIVISNDDHIALSEAISKLMNDPKLLNSYASGSDELFEQSFSQETMSMQYSTIYNKLLSK